MLVNIGKREDIFVKFKKNVKKFRWVWINLWKLLFKIWEEILWNFKENLKYCWIDFGEILHKTRMSFVKNVFQDF